MFFISDQIFFLKEKLDIFVGNFIVLSVIIIIIIFIFIRAASNQLEYQTKQFKTESSFYLLWLRQVAQLKKKKMLSEINNAITSKRCTGDKVEHVLPYLFFHF